MLVKINLIADIIPHQVRAQGQINLDLEKLGQETRVPSQIQALALAVTVLEAVQEELAQVALKAQMEYIRLTHLK